MIGFLLFLLGLALGSFINAFVWRLREKEQFLSRHPRVHRGSSKNIDSRVKPENDKYLNDLSITKGRSMCIHCHHTLAWYDLIPILSWLALSGKCRYCKKPISVQYPLVELAMAFLVLVSYVQWPYELGSLISFITFGIWVVLLVLLVTLFLYDLKWMELPTELVYLCLVLSATFVGIQAVELEKNSLLLSSVIGALVLGGLFWVLYQVSKGKWIGGGDVRLGFAMGAFLGWQKALLGLTLAAYIGTIIILIAIILGKYHKRMKLPFGPLLIAGWYISFLWGQHMIDWYLRLIGIK